MLINVSLTAKVHVILDHPSYVKNAHTNMRMKNNVFNFVGNVYIQSRWWIECRQDRNLTRVLKWQILNMSLLHHENKLIFIQFDKYITKYTNKHIIVQHMIALLENNNRN